MVYNDSFQSHIFNLPNLIKLLLICGDYYYRRIPRSFRTKDHSCANWLITVPEAIDKPKMGRKRVSLLVLFLSHSLLHFLTEEKYGWLVDGAADERIKTFIAEEHSFDEYTEVISCIIYKYTWLLFCNIQYIR